VIIVVVMDSGSVIAYRIEEGEGADEDDEGVD